MSCSTKQDNGAYHDSKQWYLLCGGNIHILVQDILERSVRFDVDQNNLNLQTVIARQNTQLQEKQVILSTIQCKNIESLPQSGNDQTKNIR